MIVVDCVADCCWKRAWTSIDRLCRERVCTRPPCSARPKLSLFSCRSVHRWTAALLGEGNCHPGDSYEDPQFVENEKKIYDCVLAVFQNRPILSTMSSGLTRTFQSGLENESMIGRYLQPFCKKLWNGYSCKPKACSLEYENFWSPKVTVFSDDHWKYAELDRRFSCLLHEAGYMVVLPVVRLLQLLVTICLVAQPQFAVL